MNLPAPPAGVTHCKRCNGTVFVQKRGKLTTVIGIILLPFIIIPAVLVLAFAPKHVRCASCGRALVARPRFPLGPSAFHHSLISNQTRGTLPGRSMPHWSAR